MAKWASAADEVAGYMARLEHPLKAEVEALREAIRGADPRLEEGVKWNAPSFSVGGQHFATLKLRPLTSVQVVLHTDARPRVAPGPITVDDPEGLLRWAAPDRAVATFTSLAEVEARRERLAAIVRQWMAQL